MNHIRNVPELHAALAALRREFVSLSAPIADGQPHHWIPCECCKAVFAVPRQVVSALCEDCTMACPHTDCGLLIHEHVDGCEPIVEVDA